MLDNGEITVLCMEETRNIYKILFVKPEGKTPLGRPKYRLKDIKPDLKQIGCKGVEWILLTWDRVQ
jgi:hypothetical protein